MSIHTTSQLQDLNRELTPPSPQNPAGQDEMQQSIPIPNGSITAGNEDWTMSDGEPFISDGLTVEFCSRSRRHCHCRHCRRRRGGKDGGHNPAVPAFPANVDASFSHKHPSRGARGTERGGGTGASALGDTMDLAPARQSSKYSCDSGGGEGSYYGKKKVYLALREHSGRFGRWGADPVREQWSCCLWEQENEGELGFVMVVCMEEEGDDRRKYPSEIYKRKKRRNQLAKKQHKRLPLYTTRQIR